MREHIENVERRVTDWAMRDDTAVDRFLDWLYWAPNRGAAAQRASVSRGDPCRSQALDTGTLSPTSSAYVPFPPFKLCGTIATVNRGGFSWKRFLGVTNAKRRVSRATGVPWTKSGRQRKLGSMFWKIFK